VALGLLAGVTDLVRAGWAPRGPIAVGRTALSCYVLCSSWALGWGGSETWRAALRLRRFVRGPLELVAHRLVRPARATGAVSGSRG